MKTLILISVIVLTGLTLVCSQFDNSKAAALDKWALWQNGPHLRGANIHQRRSYPDVDGDLANVGPVIPPYTQADFNKLAARGANYVNISHPGLFTETPPYVVDPVIQANLDQLLAMIAQANMFAVISFRTGPGRNEFIFLNEEDPGWLGMSKDINFVWTDQAAQDAWVAMWRYTAERYRNNPVVVGYDLMVEPNSNVLLNIWDPAGFYPTYANTLYDWNQFHPRLSAAIREVDPDTPILTG
ncbi:MAG: cellulase family glycosylhydrolase, partial [Chloroflexi bacterium]|nr:cellulase family glycosylhydrolase [Chloroflexota bacterium]